MAGLSVIIPANNEEDYLADCLEGVFAQTLDPASLGGAQVIVAANACTDRTVEIARGFAPKAAAAGWDLLVLDIPEGGKPGALNQADEAATGALRAYLDADVVMEPPLLAQIAEALAGPAPRYASGRLIVAPARSWVTRQFARIWTRLPFMTEGVPGAGLFCVNEAGRARWGAFPQIISDDTYVRLLFTPEERVGVAAGYTWPMVEGFRGLVKVRRRQDVGVAEVARLYPEIMGNEGKAPLGKAGLLRLAAGQPISFAVYGAVLLAVRFGAGSGTAGWTRGR